MHQEKVDEVKRHRQISDTKLVFSHSPFPNHARRELAEETTFETELAQTAKETIRHTGLVNRT
jgi:hypothetical protein